MHLNKTNSWDSNGFTVNVNYKTITEIGIVVNPKSHIKLGRIAIYSVTK